MSGARAMNNLKKLDQSVFDGLPPEYKFAAVDPHGLAWAYEQRPGVISFDGMRRFISGSFDATGWKNSLIERKEIAAAKKPLRRGDLVEFCGGVWVVIETNRAGDRYWIYEMTGKGRQDYVKAKDLTRIGSIRKKIKRLKAQFIGDEK